MPIRLLQNGSRRLTQGGFARLLQAATPPEAELPASLAKAVEALWAEAGLDVAVGRLHEDRLPASSPPPNAWCLIERGGVCLATSSGYVHDYFGRVRVRALGKDLAHQGALLVDAAIAGRGLRWQGGFARGGVREGWASGDEGRIKADDILPYYEEITYRWRVRGPR